MKSNGVADYIDNNYDGVQLKSISDISEKMKEIHEEKENNRDNCVKSNGIKNENLNVNGYGVNFENNENENANQCYSYANFSSLFIKLLCELFYK